MIFGAFLSPFPVWALVGWLEGVEIVFLETILVFAFFVLAMSPVAAGLYIASQVMASFEGPRRPVPQLMGQVALPLLSGHLVLALFTLRSFGAAAAGFVAVGGLGWVAFIAVWAFLHYQTRGAFFRLRVLVHSGIYITAGILLELSGSGRFNLLSALLSPMGVLLAGYCAVLPHCGD